MVQKNKLFWLLARPSCRFCKIAEPILQKLAKDYNLKINYLDTDEFGENDQQTLIDSNEIFKDLGTPMLLVVSGIKFMIVLMV